MFKKLWLALGALLGFATPCKAQVPTTPPADPRALTIYQIMVASFQHDPNGAEGYKAMWGPDGERKNGNLRGITAALPYIKSLGANAIWMTPVFDSSSAFGGEKLQATGYFTNDYFKIDPHFGTEADFKQLVDSAHNLGMYVILDGVFGHHGGVTTPSPNGYMLDTTRVLSNRGMQGGTGNIKYPESLPYMRDVATYWIEKYGIDGWRLDQAYQACQNGENYWHQLRGAVEAVCEKRKANGEQWGTLGYMVGEDWGNPDEINRGVYSTGGMYSAFDFDGKERISGPMQNYGKAGLEKGWDDIVTTLSMPTERGYLNNAVMPNLFLSNHDGYRLADHFDPKDPLYYRKMMTRNAILAAYSGPVTLYYGDEYADRTLQTKGGQPDNVARTSGHLNARNKGERQLRDYISKIMNLRAAHPALWRGTADFHRYSTPEGADVLVVDKTDPESTDRVLVIFSDKNASVPVPGLKKAVKVKAYIPEFIVLE